METYIESPVRGRLEFSEFIVGKLEGTGSKSVVLKSDEGLDKGCGLHSRTGSSNFRLNIESVGELGVGANGSSEHYLPVT